MIRYFFCLVSRNWLSYVFIAGIRAKGPSGRRKHDQNAQENSQTEDAAMRNLLLLPSVQLSETNEDALHR